MFPKIHSCWVPLFPDIPLHVSMIPRNILPNIFQFLMVSSFHKVYLAIHSGENHPPSPKRLFRLHDDCRITLCSLAEISVDSIRVRTRLVRWISFFLPMFQNILIQIMLSSSIFSFRSSEKHIGLNGSRIKNSAITFYANVSTPGGLVRRWFQCYLCHP